MVLFMHLFNICSGHLFQCQSFNHIPNELPKVNPRKCRRFPLEIAQLAGLRFVIRCSRNVNMGFIKPPPVGQPHLGERWEGEGGY